MQKGKLRVHDPFELIRWLALSQTDPRKALAELVQNSLDAGAGSIRVTRVRIKKVPCLRVWDDGEGVIPEMDRPEALKYLATHIGHSRKRQLTPRERLELMTQGRYGIGLLGFWCLGETLEVRTSIPGQRAHRLILHRDRPDYAIEPLRGRLPFDERWTEVLVIGVNPEALRALACRRAADYLASELRGQLLSRDVRLEVFDRMARGKAPKALVVQPPRFLGERVEDLDRLEVPGQSPIRLEIYLAGGTAGDDGAQGLSVYSAGSLVAETFHDLAAAGLDHPPWTDSRLTGLIDYPDFAVAPGSRRGVVLDGAAGAFVRALLDAEPQLVELLQSYEQRRSEELDRTLVRDLQRAFRDFYRQSPSYTLLPVEGKRGPETGSPAAPGEPAAEDLPEDEDGAAAPAETSPWPPVAELFPPGPLVRAGLKPARLTVACGGHRTLEARGYDATGREVSEGLSFEWRRTGPIGRLEPVASTPAKVTFRAAATAATGSVGVVIRQGELSAFAEAEVDVSEDLPGARSDEGIPEPELVDQPAASWRSRFRDGRWQVNSGHPEYRQIAGRPALKLRYLVLLFAKEVVLRSSQDPRLEGVLEQMVEVAAYADRNLAKKRGGRQRKLKRRR